MRYSSNHISHESTTPVKKGVLTLSFPRSSGFREGQDVRKVNIKDVREGNRLSSCEDRKFPSEKSSSMAIISLRGVEEQECR